MGAMISPGFLKIRRIARRMGLTKIIGGILAARGYEDRLGALMRASVQSGDCVWDIGANVGYYTTVFAGLVGNSGSVVAIEPSPKNAQRLLSATATFPNVTILNVGLSDHEQRALFVQGTDDLGATSKVVMQSERAESDAIEIALRTGDSLIADSGISIPNVLKIDVEGHELEVLLGLGNTLARPELRHIFIEVHFTLLDERGKSDAPAQIDRLLRANGFSLRWVDPSHIHASR